ncbi:hypothetical protein APHAL10511_004364 [Amanita phalloides]|nr:hypothetical protein APHAL10511_004364 [Amanita phalloides]
MSFLGIAAYRQCISSSQFCHRTLLRAFSSTSGRTLGPLKRKGLDEPKDKWNYNQASFSEIPDDESKDYRLMNANDLEKESSPIHGVKMLVRDFIEDSLYNPHYGYFVKHATIFDTQDTHFDFSSLKDSIEFQEEVAKKYSAYGVDKLDGPGRQLWHTPTELFKPWYGRAIAHCLVSEYLLKYFPYEDFIIYEIGAGNGTLASDMLDCIQEEYPDVYERTRYHIIEISSSLAQLQRRKLSGRHPCAKVTNRSIFRWNIREPAPCLLVAMEVIDNFAHDVVRYDLRTLQPYQGVVTVDRQGEFDMLYTPVSDPLITSFLDIRKKLGQQPPISRILRASETLRKIFTTLPFAPNLSVEEYIPTRTLSLLRTLREYFPRHRLVLSDFSSLPDTIPGVNSPVVQTRFRNVTVPCTKLLVKQGYFDIFFPTNFGQLRDLYEHILSQPSVGTSQESSNHSWTSPLSLYSSSVSLGQDFFFSRRPSNRRAPRDGVTSSTGLPVGERKSSVFTHAEFMSTYADLNNTKLRSGENPLLDFYKNVKFLF